MVTGPSTARTDLRRSAGRSIRRCEVEPEFWKQRWTEGRIGFHRDAPNPHLVRHAPRLARWPGRGFLPLSGKSVDLAWLARRGVHAVGSELAPQAVEQFFAEHGFAPHVEARAGFRRYDVAVEATEAVAGDARGHVTIWEGDFFELRPEDVGPVDWVFDRAALIAMPPPRRPAYVRQLRALAGAQAEVLLVTMRYAEGAIEGPPFSIEPEEVHAHYPGCEVQLLERSDVLGDSPHLAARGLDALESSTWLVRPPPRAKGALT